MSIVIRKASAVGWSGCAIWALGLEPSTVSVDGAWLAPDVPVERSGRAVVRACSESKYTPHQGERERARRLRNLVANTAP